MQNSTFISIFIIFSLCNSCNTSSKENKISENITSASEDTKKLSADDNRFEEYLALFEEDELPIKVDSYSINLKNIQSTEISKYNKIRVQNGFSGFTFYPFKKIRTDNNFIVLISLEESRLYVPVPIIETYTSDGTLIDLKALDFGFETTETSDLIAQNAIINPDLTFSFELIYETWDVTEEEDENGNYTLNEVLGSLVRTQGLALGRIDSKGKISIDPATTKKDELKSP